MYPNLKLQLWKSGTRQNRVAQLLGVDETFLSKIVNGHREPAPELRQAIADLLGCDAAWLFERVDVHAARPPLRMEGRVSSKRTKLHT